MVRPEVLLRRLSKVDEYLEIRFLHTHLDDFHALKRVFAEML